MDGILISHVGMAEENDHTGLIDSFHKVPGRVALEGDECRQTLCSV